MTEKIIGVYGIFSSETCYIGSSTNVVGRWNWHMVYFRKGLHPYKVLQKAYREGKLTFVLFQYCQKEQLKTVEQLWMDKFPGRCNLSSQSTLRGFKRSPETRKRMSKAAVERWRRPGFKAKASCWARKQIYKGKLGPATWSSEARSKISKASKRNWKDPSFRDKCLAGLAKASKARWGE